MSARARYHFDNTYPGMRRTVGPFILYQAGDLSCEPGYEVGEHVQRVAEITCVVSGGGAAETDGERTPLRPGTLYLNGMGERHNIVAGNEGLRFFYLGFLFAGEGDTDALRQMRAFFLRPAPRCMEGAPAVQDAFLGLLSQLACRDAFSDMLLESYITQILCGVYRLFHRQAQYTYFVDEARGADDRLIAAMMQHIDARLGDPRCLSSLAAEFGYSYVHLSRRFLSATGRTLKSYYDSRLFERACARLAAGMRVTAVAELMGYRSIASFSGAFKKHCGMSPTEYQRRYQRGISPEK